MSKETPSQPTPSIDVPEQPIATGAPTGREREAIVDAIVDEITKDSIKEDALEKLKKANWLYLLSKFFQHPVILLVIGFALTGWIGAWLTAAWQSREWDRQQLRLIEIHNIDLKYGIIDEVTKALGERNASARVIINPLLEFLDNKQLAQAEAEPIKAWPKASYEWRVNSEVLRVKLAIHIKNPEAVKLFEGIIEEEKDIEGWIADLKINPSEYNREEEKEDVQTDIQQQLDIIKKTEMELRQLADVIAAEVRTDALGNNP